MDPEVEPTRVVAVATTVPAEPGDGTPEFVLTLARHLEGCRVTVVAPRVRGCDLDQELDGVRIRRFPYAPRAFERLADEAILPALRSEPRLLLQVPGLFLGLLRATFREVRLTRAQVIHAHWILPGGLVALLVRRVTGVPFVVTAHGADAHAFGGPVGRWLKRLVLRSAAGVHAVSEEIAAKLDDIAPGCVSHVAPMGVEVEEIRSLVGERCPDPDLLVFVGRLADKKGVDVLIDALGSLPGHVRLEVVGDGPSRMMLEQRTRTQGVEDRVEFAGTQRRTGVVSSLRRAAVVVIPSRTAADGDRDGTPVVLMEAMAAGAPVVATTVGGIAEHAEDKVHALLVPEADSLALAGAITTCLTEGAATSQRVDAAIELAYSAFDVRSIGRELAALLHRAVPRHAQPPSRSPAVEAGFSDGRRRGGRWEASSGPAA